MSTHISCGENWYQKQCDIMYLDSTAYFMKAETEIVRLVKETYERGKRGIQKSNVLNLIQRNTKAGLSEGYSDD